MNGQMKKGATQAADATVRTGKIAKLKADIAVNNNSIGSIQAQMGKGWSLLLFTLLTLAAACTMR